MDIFGSTNGYHRSDEGLQLKNFLADNNGKRVAAFLYEFDKTSQEVREGLLTIVEQGPYQYRRYNKMIDCTKTIWILATNFGDSAIEKYYDRDIRGLGEDARDKAPFTGRIRLMVPFLPFSHPEQSVGLQKFFLDLTDHFRQRIDLSEDAKRYWSYWYISVVEAGKFCAKKAKRFYVAKHAARNLVGAIPDIEDKLIESYQDTDELVSEGTNESPFQKYVVKLIPARDDHYSVGVYEDQGNDDI
ncbi:hypothetical protein BCR34DRAFT_612695 [Clohesyomyces aquaticus]|uniref:ATPase AAA-type core domain-containing protein n=1 Tax=Clohesyomyces aquaticus TaxID=1231657 RepID=A0A1Y1ZWB6_9PLEO|nr:hypothetical protein BCR34DRAFT_612695 [Clohesyomyces aquaticus]